MSVSFPKKTSPRLIVNGAVYKQAQLQELLQQYESASGKIISLLTNAHKAALGQNFDQANKALEELEQADVVQALKELNDTMAGHVGMGGN